MVYRYKQSVLMECIDDVMICILYIATCPLANAPSFTKVLWWLICAISSFRYYVAKAKRCNFAFFAFVFSPRNNEITTKLHEITK